MKGPERTIAGWPTVRPRNESAVHSGYARQIDEHFRDRSSIHDGALARALARAEADPGARRALRLAVFHHPVTGNEKIVDDAFLERLAAAGFKLCLHGHVHEQRADLVGHLDEKRRLHMVGAGSFGAPAAARPPSTPQLYNLLEIDAEKVRVHTRQRPRQGGAWRGWAVWPGAVKHEQRSYYDIPFFTRPATPLPGTTPPTSNPFATPAPVAAVVPAAAGPIQPEPHPNRVMLGDAIVRLRAQHPGYHGLAPGQPIDVEVIGGVSHRGADGRRQPWSEVRVQLVEPGAALADVDTVGIYFFGINHRNLVLRLPYDVIERGGGAWAGTHSSRGGPVIGLRLAVRLETTGPADGVLMVPLGG